jgi:hypothetical protein
MILKLIKTNNSPKIGDLVKDKISNDLIVICSNEHCYALEGSVTVVKPYGISDEEIKAGDKYLIYDEHSWFLRECVKTDIDSVYSKDGWACIVNCKKVNILPEQFNYEEIVDLWLKDGDELKLKTKKTAILHERVQHKGYYEKSDITGYVDTIKWGNGKVSIAKPTLVTYTEEEAVKDFFAKDKFEKGKWYYSDFTGTKYLIRYKETIPVYTDKDIYVYNKILYTEGFTVYPEGVLECSKNDHIANTKLEQSLQPATTEQIQIMLGKVAESKGYVKGAKVKKGTVTQELSLMGYAYLDTEDILYCGSISIYQEGKWAELLPKEEPKSSDVKTEHVRAFVKEWMEGHEPDTFITNEHGNYMYSAGPTSINLVAFFEELVQDYIDYDPQPQAKEAKPETLVLKDVVYVDKGHYHKRIKTDLHLTATHLQQLKEYLNK